MSHTYVLYNEKVNTVLKRSSLYSNYRENACVYRRRWLANKTVVGVFYALPEVGLRLPPTHGSNARILWMEHTLFRQHSFGTRQLGFFVQFI